MDTGPPPPGHAAPPPYVAPIPAEVGVEDEAAVVHLAQVTAMVARTMRGMSQPLGCGVRKVTCMVADRMQMM